MIYSKRHGSHARWKWMDDEATTAKKLMALGISPGFICSAGLTPGLNLYDLLAIELEELQHDLPDDE